MKWCWNKCSCKSRIQNGGENSGRLWGCESPNYCIGILPPLNLKWSLFSTYLHLKIIPSTNLVCCCSILWILCHCEKLTVAVEARNASLQNKIWPSSWTKEQHWPTSRLRQIREKFLKFNFDNLILWESWLLVFKTKSGLSQIKNQQPKSDGRGDYSDISVKERKATHLSL